MKTGIAAVAMLAAACGSTKEDPAIAARRESIARSTTAATAEAQWLDCQAVERMNASREPGASLRRRCAEIAPDLIPFLRSTGAGWCIDAERALSWAAPSPKTADARTTVKQRCNPAAHGGGGID